MRKLLYMCVVMASLALLSGCASVLNPFQSEFACPSTDKGKCISIKGAYQEDVSSTVGGGVFNEEDVLPATDPVKAGMITPEQAAQASQSQVKDDKPCCGGKPDTSERPVKQVSSPNQQVKNDIPKQEYREASLKKVTKLLREPVTPIVAPPQVMRVLILPYEDDDGALNLMRYKYVMVDRPKWVLGDYLSKEEEAE